MVLELTKEEEEVLERTHTFNKVEEFQAALERNAQEMSQIIIEVFAPNKPVRDTLKELRRLALLVWQYRQQLVRVRYDDERVALFFDAIRLLDTANTWFAEKIGTGAFSPKTIAEILGESIPWREELRAYANYAFVFDRQKALMFADVNTSKKLEEEEDDLLTLNGLIDQHREMLIKAGMPPEFELEGKRLYLQAKGHDLLGILGIESQNAALELRNKLLTYAILLSKEARAAGSLVFIKNDDVRSKFAAATFQRALRRLRSRRVRRTTVDDETIAPDEEPTTDPTGEPTPASPEDVEPS